MCGGEKLRDVIGVSKNIRDCWVSILFQLREGLLNGDIYYKIVGWVSDWKYIDDIIVGRPKNDQLDGLAWFGVILSL